MEQNIIMKHFVSHLSENSNYVIICVCIHSEKNPARPMLFYSTNYWQKF